jgi:hypothetical protein
MEGKEHFGFFVAEERERKGRTEGCWWPLLCANIEFSIIY